MESEAEREMKQRQTQTALRNDEKERNTNPLESISLYPCRVSSLHRFLSVSFSFDPLLALLYFLALFPAAFSILQHLSTPFQTVFSPHMFPLPLQCFLRRPSLQRMALAFPLSRKQGGVVRHVHGRLSSSLSYSFFQIPIHTMMLHCLVKDMSVSQTLGRNFYNRLYYRPQFRVIYSILSFLILPY